MWAQQFGGFKFEERQVVNIAGGEGSIDLGYYKFCSISGLGGERPHGYVFRSNLPPDAQGRYFFQAYYKGYGATMDLWVTCID